MDVYEILISVFLLAAGAFLIAAVLMQQGKSHGLSGAIAGGAETFFGKEKGKRWDKILSRLTTIIGTLFLVAVLVLYIAMPDYSQKFDYTNNNWGISPYQSTTVTEIEKDA